MRDEVYELLVGEKVREEGVVHGMVTKEVALSPLAILVAFNNCLGMSMEGFKVEILTFCNL